MVLYKSSRRVSQEIGRGDMIMEKKIGVVHVLAYCLDCGWTSEALKNGQALAAIHARKHKHLVGGEVGLAFKYNGRQEVKE